MQKNLQCWSLVTLVTTLESAIFPLVILAVPPRKATFHTHSLYFKVTF